MGTRKQLLEMLDRGGDEYLSGAAIAGKLGITRAAVWKQIKSLQLDGYQIEAIHSKGYRLAGNHDVLSEDSVKAFLGSESGAFTLEVYDTVSSTNTLLKSKAERAPDWTVLIAGKQTAGRGRIGRSFYSPSGTGIYLSVLLRQNIGPDPGRLTTAVAIAACRAIEQCTGRTAQIKWVNDVFIEGKKVCGILTEASVNYETGIPDCIIAGIGFNVYPPSDGFPSELSQTAGAITESRQANLRSRLAAEFLLLFRKACENLNSVELLEEYRKRCFILGEPIFVLRGEERIPATAISLREDFALIVRYEDGREEALRAGEVSIRPTHR